MTRPTTRVELLDAAGARYAALTELIAGMTPDERTSPLRFGPAFSKPEAHWQRDRNLRDVLVHLASWHGLLLDWVSANERGEAVPFLPAPYSWRNYAGMNVEFRDSHVDTTLAEALAALDNSHASVLDLIARYTDVELFEKQHFSWTGTTSLGAYCVSATSSHYDWACKKLRLAIRTARSNQ